MKPMKYNLNKQFAFFAALLSVFIAVSITPVSALTSTTNTTRSAATTDDKASRDTRIEAYKKNLKETLTTTAKTRITDRCVAAQALVKTKSASTLTASSARVTTYATIADELQTVADSANSKGADVLPLEDSIKVLKVKITAFQNASTTYQQGLNDLAALDCKVDPTAFKAALETARTAQASVLTSAKDIKTYLSTDIKTELKAITDQGL